MASKRGHGSEEMANILQPALDAAFGGLDRVGGREGGARFVQVK